MVAHLDYGDDQVRGHRCDNGKEHVRVNGVLLYPKPLANLERLPNEDSQPFHHSIVKIGNTFE